MRTSRSAIQSIVQDSDIFQDVDIKQTVKEAKIGWLKALIVIAVWPILKSILQKKVNPKLIDLIDDVLQQI